MRNGVNLRWEEKEGGGAFSLRSDLPELVDHSMPHKKSSLARNTQVVSDDTLDLKRCHIVAYNSTLSIGLRSLAQNQRTQSSSAKTRVRYASNNNR